MNEYALDRTRSCQEPGTVSQDGPDGSSCVQSTTATTGVALQESSKVSASNAVFAFKQPTIKQHLQRCESLRKLHRSEPRTRHKEIGVLHRTLLVEGCCRGRSISQSEWASSQDLMTGYINYTFFSLSLSLSCTHTDTHIVLPCSHLLFGALSLSLSLSLSLPPSLPLPLPPSLFVSHCFVRVICLLV